jgi:Sigma-70, region 4.
LTTLNARDRQLVVARIEAQWTHDEIARHFAMRTSDAARMAVSRALQRLLGSVDA